MHFLCFGWFSPRIGALVVHDQVYFQSPYVNDLGIKHKELNAWRIGIVQDSRYSEHFNWIAMCVNVQFLH